MPVRPYYPTTSGGAALTVSDVDGNPSASSVTHLRFTNGAVTDDGGGTVTVSTAGTASGALLGYKSYAGSATYTATSGTLVDADATNLAVSFTAPASGNVLVRLTGTMRLNAAVANRVLWGLRESTTNIGGGDSAGVYVGYAFTGSVSILQSTSVAFVLTGVSAGAHTYKWAIGCTANGGGLLVDASNPATMEVWGLA